MRLLRRAGALAPLLAALTGIAVAADDDAMLAGQDFREIVQRAKARVFPAVVYVRCISENNESGKRESQVSSGSGVIVSREGHVLTNWHVIDKATSVRCLLSDGRHSDAVVLGSDKDTDLAVLKIDPGRDAELPVAEFAASDEVSEGDFVMAMGAPWGLNRSVSIGIVSCARRFLDGVSEYSHWIQTDAAINPGNSGGPLVNTEGEIVGINARGISFADGMGFAIPIPTVKLLYPALRDHGAMNWSFTGLQLQPLRDFDSGVYFDGEEGVIVAGTDPDSPAQLAGLVSRDRIVAIDGEAVKAITREDLPAVRRRLGLLPLGAVVVLTVESDGVRREARLEARQKGQVEGAEKALLRFDFTVKAINQFANPSLFFHKPQGVFVLAVKRPGNAQKAGIAPNDILLRIDGTEVDTIEGVMEVHQRVTADLDRKNRVLVEVLRGGLLRQIVLDLGRDYSKE
jgi:serine protease Do